MPTLCDKRHCNLNTREHEGMRERERERECVSGMILFVLSHLNLLVFLVLVLVLVLVLLSSGVHNEQLLEVKCVSDRGCSPSDEAPCSGITFEDVKGIEPGMPYLMTATGFTHGSAGAMACLSVRSSQQGHTSGIQG